MQMTLGDVENLAGSSIGDEGYNLAVGVDPGGIDSVAHGGLVASSGTAVAVDNGAPDVGDDVAEDMTVDVIVVLSPIRHHLGGGDVVLYDEKGQGELVVNILQELYVGRDLGGSVGGGRSYLDSNLGRLCQYGVDFGRDIGSLGGVDELWCASNEAAIDDRCWVRATGSNSVKDAKGIAVVGAEVGISIERTSESSGVVDGDGYEAIAIGCHLGGDGFVGGRTVDATYTGIFLKECTLALVGNGGAFFVFNINTGKLVVETIVGFNFVAAPGKCKASEDCDENILFHDRDFVLRIRNW